MPATSPALWKMKGAGLVCYDVEEGILFMSGLQIAGITILLLIILALIAVGAYNIGKGLRALPQAEALGQEPVWHKQPNILLGINNIAFAVLVCLVALLSVVAAPGRVVLLILIVITFLLSIFLVIRTANSAFNAAKKLREKQISRRS